MKQVYLVERETGGAVALVHGAEADMVASRLGLTVTPVPLLGTAPTWFEDAEGEDDGADAEG